MRLITPNTHADLNVHGVPSQLLSHFRLMPQLSIYQSRRRPNASAVNPTIASAQVEGSGQMTNMKSPKSGGVIGGLGGLAPPRGPEVNEHDSPRIVELSNVRPFSQTRTTYEALESPTACPGTTTSTALKSRCQERSPWCRSERISRSKETTPQSNRSCHS